MNWQYLRYFEVVAEEQHFTRAAQKLFITTSALSRAITSLEEELHVELFSKNGRNVSLTKYGETFQRYVKQATAMIDEGCKELEQMSTAAYGDIIISAIPSFASTVLPGIIKAYCAKWPNVHFTIRQGYSLQIATTVLNGEAEFGFASDYIDRHRFPELDFHKIMDENVVLIVPENHPWSGRQSMTLDELANEKFISFDKTSSILGHIENIFHASGYTFQKSMVLSDDFSIAAMVRSGMGIAIIPEGKEAVSKKGLSVIHLEDTFTRNIYMVWKKSAFSSYAADQFREFVEQTRPEEWKGIV